MSDENREAARQRAIADACLRADATPTGRLALYRRLVRNNLKTVLRRLLPRTCAELDRQASFDAWFDRFLSEAGPRTPYLRDVAAEFVEWAIPCWTGESTVSAFLRDLARHELDRFVVECGVTDETPTRLSDVAVDRRVALARPNLLAHYQFDVVAPGSLPLAGETHVFLYRDDENTVRAATVDRDEALLLGKLLEGATLGQALAAAAPALREPLGLASWLEHLGAVGALLGGEG